jgi:hypothetical protein
LVACEVLAGDEDVDLVWEVACDPQPDSTSKKTGMEDIRSIFFALFILARLEFLISNF